MNRLPERFTPHTVQLAAYSGGGSLGGRHAAPVDAAAFVVDEHTVITGADGKEAVSSANVSVNFDEHAPIGSRVTLWPGTSIARTANVVKITRFQHPTLPWHQVLWLQ